MSGATTVPLNALESFSRRFRGDLLQPDHSEYDDARKVWNGMVDRRPALIARCTNVNDVVEAVRFAREQDLPIAVRGGGHNAAGLAVNDGGIVIDLSQMNDVQVDPVRKTARAGGGANWGQFDRATQQHGLATTGGAISSTGVAGLTLGGGLGWLMRSYGMTADNLLSVELVSADGTIVRASAEENPDLFWGVRGGGGNFGIVTSFEFRLHAVGPVIGGMLVHPFTRADEALRFYRDFTQSAPDALTIFAGMMHSPEGEKITAFVLCYNGDIAEGERVLRRLREFGPPAADQVATMPYTAQQSMLDAGFPPGLQVHWRSEFLTSLTDDAIDTFVDYYSRVPSPLTAVMLEQFGGAVQRVDHNSTAFDQRDADYNLVIASRWTDPADAEKNVAWTRALSDAAKPFTNGRVYVNYLGYGEAPERVRAAFSEEKFRKLVALKTKYDPSNVFRYNQNIPPR